jgi:hypothetical protein
MNAKEQIPAALDDVVQEIASILARGFVRYHSSRRLTLDPEGTEAHVTQPKESEKVTQE